MFGSRQKLKYLVSFSSVDCCDSNFSCYCLLRTKFVHLKVKKVRFAKKGKTFASRILFSHNKHHYKTILGIHWKQFVVFRLSNFCLNGYPLKFHPQTQS